MNLQTLNLTMNLLLILGGLFTLYGLYFCFIAAFGLKKSPSRPDTAPTTKFAVVIAARNEEKVIGALLESLHKQNYPKDMVDIYVAPNNCTDNTEQVARVHGAKIFTPKGPITMKGQVLHQLCAKLQKHPAGYDAICVFDADNVVHPNFLQKMNNAYKSGAKVAQGYRDSKNPRDSAMTICYTIYYWVVNRFYNGGREALGLSSLVVGSGYMMSTELLQKLGGWNTCTITEDYEFSGQCVLAGERVHYVQDAIAYDELPLTFGQSWKQRRRWSTGFVQSMQLYMGDLFRFAAQKRSFVVLDMALAYIAPITQLVSLLCGVASLLFSVYGILLLHVMPVTQAVWLLVAGVVLIFTASCVFAALVVRAGRLSSLKGLGKGIALFAIFLISFIPIGIISLFFHKTNWESISHTRSMGIADIHRG